MQANQKSTTRRQFAKWLAAATAGAGASATMAATALASSDDDSALLQLEEQIFDAWHAANADNDETCRISEVRSAVYDKLVEAEKAQLRFISSRDRWELVFSDPEVQRLDRLVTLSDQHWGRMNELVERMWAIPANTEAGRNAKVIVLLSCILDWRDRDEELDWRPFMARRLLIDFVGGEAAESLRGQFA